jgi:hypothetical protein|tara:strand:+ start:131 stop:430 length:300 start_codon:yes stop_codon:yes gene_type:complete
MPTYSFKNNDTGEEWEEFFSISGKEEFLKENDHIVQLPSLVSIVSDVGGIRNDGGWKDNMSRIAEAHPGSPLARRYGKKSTKDINTRQVLKKHKILKDV